MWLRRLTGRLELVRGWFTAVVVAVVVDPVLPGPAGSGWADLVTAVAAAASAVAARFELAAAAAVAAVMLTPVDLRVAEWVCRAAAAMSSGRLLAPGWPAVGAGTAAV